MPTLFVHRQYKRGLGGPWDVTDGATRLATGADALRHHRHYQMDIDTGGRRCTARKHDDESAFEVTDDTTDKQLIGLRFTDFGHSARGRREVASVEVASTGATLSWNHLPAERQLGFYETNGAPVMQSDGWSRPRSFRSSPCSACTWSGPTTDATATSKTDRSPLARPLTPGEGP